MISLLAAAMTAAAPAHPTFDLAKPAAPPAAREAVQSAVLEVPRGLDTRPAAPEIELALLDMKQGPVLRIGALGGRHRAAPKLAHVAVGWRF